MTQFIFVFFSFTRTNVTKRQHSSDVSNYNIIHGFYLNDGRISFFLNILD